MGSILLSAQLCYNINIMATYKVPQDVEADDKLIGPFTFRQFIYLMIVLGAITLAVMLFQVFPLLSIIPIPFALFFIILALPIKKDQPMETYLAALVSFYTKPNRRFWIPGLSESTILITAPKKKEASRTRDITSEEAGHRLSFLANIVDTEGYAIKSASSPMRDEFYAEAVGANDMFDQTETNRLNHLITKEQEEHHEEIVNQMRNAIAHSEQAHRTVASMNQTIQGEHTIQPRVGFATTNVGANANAAQTELRQTLTPITHQAHDAALQSSVVVQPETNPDNLRKMTELAHTNNLSVETLQKQADRIRQENDNEVYVSLH